MILISNKDFTKITFKDVEKFLLNFDNDESFFVELKNDSVTSKDLTKEICAFSNTFGGYFFLGVEDDKRITGCSNWTEEKISNVIRNNISPIPNFDIKKLSKDKLKIFIIKVEEGSMPPYVGSKGIIYERISSSSFPVKDSGSINRLFEKRKDNIRKIEEKLYISPINTEIGNLCAYIDFGFSLISKDYSKIRKCIENANYEEIALVLSETEMVYSISKVGFSICVYLGEAKCKRGSKEFSSPARVGNFMEILPDGSVRCRIVLVTEDESDDVYINSTLYFYNLFKKIYKIIFNNGFCKNFIEARCYEKLNVIRAFHPKLFPYKTYEYSDKLEKFHNEHVRKYGGNLIFNSNRVPLNDFYVIDKREFEKFKIKFTDQNLINELFYTNYFELGYIDNLCLDDE